jgi:hypothetical protein
MGHASTGLGPRFKGGDLTESVLGSIPLMATTTTATPANDNHTLEDRAPILDARSVGAEPRGSGWAVWYVSDHGVSHRVWTGAGSATVAAAAAGNKPFDEVVEGIRR